MILKDEQRTTTNLNHLIKNRFNSLKLHGKANVGYGDSCRPTYACMVSVCVCGGGAAGVRLHLISFIPFVCSSWANIHIFFYFFWKLKSLEKKQQQRTNRPTISKIFDNVICV